MLKKHHLILYIFMLSIGFIMFGRAAAHTEEACSPGIPCTGYDITSAPNTNDDKSDSGACDGNFMNQIYGRAFMEASRDIIMSEQLIHKPDSVLEYTCFDQRIAATAHHAGPIFSESQKWKAVSIELWTGGQASTYGGGVDHGTIETINDTGTRDGLTDQEEYSVFTEERLDHVLEDFLFDTLGNYIDDNFEHTFLGEALTLDNDIETTSIGDGSYTCSHMSTIWNVAKCIDFGEDDRFRSFEHLASFDPRSIPVACSPSAISSDAAEEGNDGTKLDNTAPGQTDGSGGMPSGGIITQCPEEDTAGGAAETGITSDIIKLANNCGSDDGGSDTGDGNAHIYAALDIIKTYMDIIKNPDTGPACSDPLPTGLPIITHNYAQELSAAGIRVERKTYEIHLDHVCPTPGCFYQPQKVPYTLGATVPESTTGTCSPF